MAKRKLKVGVIFGGKSIEHEVSLQTAKRIIDALDKNKYDISPIGITKSGRWLLQDKANYLLNSSNPKNIKLNRAVREVAMFGKNEEPIDVFFPVFHGLLGEDGTIQGLLKLTGKPFVGAGVLGSAVGLDKDVQKRLLREAGIPVADFITFTKRSNPGFQEIQKRLGKIVFVKPVNAGSSIGIAKVKNEKEYKIAVKNALKYDTKVIVEKVVVGREIECGVIGNEKLMVSLPGEIIPKHEFYDYSAKYIDEDGAEYVVPAKLSKSVTKRLQNTAKKVYKVLGCEGMGRVDMFLTKSGKIYVNEINTIPGPVMFRRMWQASGLNFSKLLEMLIGFALERHESEKKLKTSY